MKNWNSRRSTVYAKNGIVASSQPLASEVGVSILKQGGNAADAAVAVAAALNVTEPTSTGIGGDCFALFYDGKEVHGVNGSGRAPSALNIEYLKESGVNELSPFSVHTVTVPGAAAGWVDTVKKFGKMELKDVLAPAIALAKEGFPVAPITAKAWQRGAEKQLKIWENGEEMLINGKAPKVGQIMKLPTLGKTFEEVAENGKDGFYSGRVAEAIINTIQKYNGVMGLDDLANHESSFDAPVSVNYRGIDVYEIPPNGQGIIALMALNLLEGFDIESSNFHSTEHLHTLIEIMRIAFSDGAHYISDPEFSKLPTSGLLDKDYAKKRRSLISPNSRNNEVIKGEPLSGSDTVYFSIVDKDGNACSFINSNYMGFGTGLIPSGCGFTLQNRGHNFSLDPNHLNSLAPKKRPYHTIIPGMALRNGELFSSFGVMGGFMQPQGHLQVISNMVDYQMDPQKALDAPRFCIVPENNGNVHLEEGIPIEIMSDLALLGHTVIPTSKEQRGLFGRGQIINFNPKNGVKIAGSDPRADGSAVGY